MRVSSVIINNYKSIGTVKNTLLLEDDVTALIGKNDSGKSNVLEILGGISFSHYILDEFYKFNNKIDNEETSLIVELKFTQKESVFLKEYKNIEDDYGIQNCWNKMIDILSKDINETVAYLENCSEEDIYFISEVFEDVSEQLQSKEYIECLRKLDDKFPNLDMTKDIDLAEEYI